MRCFTTSSLLLALLASGASAEVGLVFQREGKEVRRATAAEISKAVTPVEIKFQDSFYDGRTKSYRCWPIKALMDAMYGPGWGRPPLTEVVTTAADGYASQSAAALLREDGGCLAFEDLDAGGGRWEPIGRKQANPGPFFLVWTKPGQDTAHAYPWPYQLAEIDLISFEKRYPEVVPRGAKETSPEWRGYQVFRNRCMRCHSINREGGKIGPDLNAPQSVTAYRTQAWVKSYVKQPSKYRYTEMPDHPDLGDADLTALWRYFKLKSAQPEKDWK